MPTQIVIVVPSRPVAFAGRPSKILSKVTAKPRDAVRNRPFNIFLITAYKKPTLQRVELCILMNSLFRKA